MHGHVEKQLKQLEQELLPAVDVVLRKLTANEKEMQLLYIGSLCDSAKIQQYLVGAFFQIADQAQYISYLYSIPVRKTFETEDELRGLLLRGNALVGIEGNLLAFEIKNIQNPSAMDATVETTIQGPQTGFSEALSTNINLIRSRYHQASLRIEPGVVGKVGKQNVAVIYDEELASAEVLARIQKSLEEAEEDVVQALGQLERIITKKKRRLIPTMIVTERPDRVVLNLSQGKIIILMDGTPFALIAPAIFYDFMSSMEDMYQPYWVAHFLVTLRYLGLAVSLILPAAYIGITSYNPEIFRVQLALSIAGSRVGVPYPSYLEVIFMLLMMELLIEASIRLPKSIGSTATTVGGLILGQAATEAALASNIMIVIVSAVAISNFVIPINEMSFSMRVIKYVFLGVATVGGLVGLIACMMLFLFYLVSLDSFGQPYLKVFLRDKPVFGKTVAQQKAQG
ncbi:spore germination protein [Ectobacillus ponti]|uniref:Spore germination protein n=1 Tax=Ectobacillus ponti TaxID=2961894 RepID=A0AA41XEP8_9BACI|nr:spore germination protein [Ectobacillus ponti]MCP8970726.1 spore germination protein [Ectobacillus ponti]